MTLEEYCANTNNIQEDVLRLRIENERLQKENAELNATLDLRRMQLDDSAEIIKEMQSKVDKLQKGNAELKENWRTDHDTIAGHTLGLIDLLAQAKELLQRVCEWANWEGENCPNFADIVKQAEQFLKE